MSRWRKDPLEVCGGQHANATLAYHECLCRYDYRNQRSYQALKFKHCLLADEMRRIDNFELYVIIAVVIGVILIFGVAAFCSCKWYLQTKSNPCGCFSCCKKKRKKKKDDCNVGNQDVHQIDEPDSTGQAWTPMHLVLNKDVGIGSLNLNPDDVPKDDERNRSSSGLCMNFCLSDPVQDCCEFFDCDIMWRKKSIYTIPIFGRRKPAPLQRRPTRPAPPPPKPVVAVLKYPEPALEGFEDGFECEPVPEAPPSPEPVRTDQPRAMYVDPLSFLQRPFLKTSKEKAIEDEPDALYSKVKEFVFGKSKKSTSVASLNKLSISKSPDAVSTTSSKKSKYGRTGSLASLHNLSDEQLDIRYNSKRSLSLASLNMVEQEPYKVAPRVLAGRSRGSLHNICEDEDLHLSQKTDEYIDLEEMSKRIEAKMLAAQGNGANSIPVDVVPKSVAAVSRQNDACSSPLRSNWTPNFIPASAYTKPSKAEDPVSVLPPVKHTAPQVHSGLVIGDSVPSYGQTYACISPDSQYGSHYYPPVPATPEKPAIPARIAVGLPIINSGTLGRPKPTVPPRPPGSGGSSPRPRCGNSPKPRAPQPPSGMTAAATTRHPHVTKPTAPPPPPPVSVPIESSL